MKNYRVDYISGNTGLRNHRDFATLKGALKFVDSIGRNDCLVKQYSPWSLCFEPLPNEALEAERKDN